MSDPDAVSALLDKEHPMPEWSGGAPWLHEWSMYVAASNRVRAARRELAESLGWSQLDLLRANLGL